MAEYQIPGGPFVIEDVTVAAQIPGYPMFIIMDAGVSSGGATLSGSALTSGAGTKAPGHSIPL